jgi:hypothetical protein
MGEAIITRRFIVQSATTPTTGAQGIFTGATIPLTYKDNTHTYENEYEYNSNSHNITITGLDGRATITNNGSKKVTVAFDVTSGVSSLKNFTINCVKGDETLTYSGLHAHYGATTTGILTFAFNNITKDGSEGTIGAEYIFIDTSSTTLPYFSTITSKWQNIYSYQVLNTLIGNFSSTSIGNSFLQYCYSFNQPLTIPSGVTSTSDNFLFSCYSFNQPLTIPSGVTSIGTNVLANCYTFNQPLTISGATSIGNGFLYNCYSFNQPLTIPSGVTSIGVSFLNSCYAFNQPLTIPSGITSIPGNFLSYCYSFNQPLTIPGGVTSIGNYFLAVCYSFKQPLTIPSGVASIGTYFLQNCYSFNQPLTIPSDVTSIGTYFLHGCYALSAINYNASVYPTDSNSLSQNSNSKTSTTGSGIKVYGTNRAGLMTSLPNRTASPYRKLIDGGS